MLQDNKSHVRIITLDELSFVREISAENGSVKPDHYWQRCREGIENNNMNVLMAYIESVPVGYTILNWKPKYRFYDQFDIPEIQDLNVLMKYRKRGIGQSIIEACEDRAREKGCSQMGISYGLTREYGAAQRLYARLGYLPDGLGVTYDRQPVTHGQIRPVDDNLCLMLVKDLTLEE